MKTAGSFARRTATGVIARQRGGHQMNKTNPMIRRHVRMALGLLAGAVAVHAQAQEAPKASADALEEIEEVVVTGFRASLNEALNDKRASAAAIDSIHAEDIAKFP